VEFKFNINQKNLIAGRYLRTIYENLTSMYMSWILPIENWDNFIQVDRRAGNHNRIIYLYERCLITCVSNEAFWLNYLEYLFFVKDDTGILSDVFNRSLLHHLKSLQLNFKYIDFCEAKGWVD